MTGQRGRERARRFGHGRPALGGWVCALGVLLAAPAWAAPVVPPARLSGYTLHYTIRWNGLPAARARAALETDGPTVPTPGHRLEVNGWTLPLLRLIWPARTRVEAVVGPDFSSRHFFMYQKERRKEETAELTFDPHAELLHIVRRKTGGPLEETTRPLENLQDPLSLIYTLRERAGRLGETQEARVALGDNVYHVTVTTTDRGTVRLAGRRVPVLCLTPTAEKVRNGERRPMTKVDGVRVWVTDDELRLPVGLRARAFVGRITMSLHHVTPALEDLYASLEAERARTARMGEVGGVPAGE